MFFNHITLDLEKVRQLVRDSKIPLSEIREADLLRQFIICYPLFNYKNVNFLGQADYLKLLINQFGQVQVRSPFDVFCIYFLSYPDDFGDRVKLLLNQAVKSLRKPGKGILILPKNNLKSNLIGLIQMQTFLESLNLKISDFDGQDVSQNFLVIQICRNFN